MVLMGNNLPANAEDRGVFGLKPLVPNVFRTRDWSRGRQFSHGLGAGRGDGFRIIHAQ